MDRVNYLRYARLLWAARHYYFVDIIWMDSERVTIYRFFTVIYDGMEWPMGIGFDIKTWSETCGNSSGGIDYEIWMERIPNRDVIEQLHMCGLL